jgi:hypothetical protein
MALKGRRTLHSILVVMSLAFASPIHAAEESSIGPPQFGPMARPAQPLILLPKPNDEAFSCRNDPICDQLPELWHPAYWNKVQHTERAVSRAAPDLDLAAAVREAFKCGAEGSICSELVVLEPTPSQRLEEAVQTLLESRQWTQARAVSVYWGRGGGLVTHASLRELKFEDKLDLRMIRPVVKRLVVAGYPVLVTAVIVAPENDQDPNAEAWGPDITVPKAATIRASLLQLEPQMQMALSWGANNDSSLHRSILERSPPLRRMKKRGIQCDGMKHCNEFFAGIIDGRIWSWHTIALVGGVQPAVLELRSRPHWDLEE